MSVKSVRFVLLKRHCGKNHVPMYWSTFLTENYINFHGCILIAGIFCDIRNF